MKGIEQCFAIVRVDDFMKSAPSVAVENLVTVKLILWDLEEARREVERLNLLNVGKGCRYFCAKTRAMRRDPSGG